MEKLIQGNLSTAPVAAVITEPIQAEGGDNHAPAEWFISLQKVCKKYDVALIIDEVRISSSCDSFSQINLIGPDWHGWYWHVLGARGVESAEPA